MEITNLKMQMIHIDNIPKKVLSIMNDGYLYYHEDESNYPIYDGGCFSNIIFNGFGLSEELLNKVIRLNQLTNCDYLMVKTD